MIPEERTALIAAYGDGPGQLRMAWEAVPREVRTWRPAPGEWSAHEVVVHCADSETYAATRIRLLLAERDPLIVGYDQVRWADVFDYHQRDPELALRVVETVRAQTHALIAGLANEAWTRAGTHTESGPYSAADWLRTYGAHLRDHAAQIRANVEAWRIAQP